MSVIRLPIPQPPDDDGLAALIRRRFDGSHTTDQWGLDDDLARVVGDLVRLRWSIEVTGLDILPDSGPVVLVCNRRFGWTEPIVLAGGLSHASERTVRLVGCPDLDPFGSLGRRLGAVSSRPDEIKGMLRDGQLLALPTSRELTRNRVGSIPLHLLEAAAGAGAMFIPAAIKGHELGRRWHIVLGDPVTKPQGSGPRAVGELAVRTSAALQALLDDAGARTPLHRLRNAVLGHGR